MRVYTKIVVDLATDTIIERHGHDYTGPITECISFGGGSKSKSKSQQESHARSDTGTRFNPSFLDQATRWVAGKPAFDRAAYLTANPDVANDPIWSKDPYGHYITFGRAEGREGRFLPAEENLMPGYNPAYVRSDYVRVAPEGFQRLEDTAYESQRSKLARAYEEGVARQREELAQMGALNSPSQFLEGSARSSLDRSYMDNLQQAARDAFSTRIGLEEREAGRETAFKTAEAARETGFNEETAARLIDLWMKKIALAIESGRFGESRSDSLGFSSGSSSQPGSFGASASLLPFLFG